MDEPTYRYSKSNETVIIEDEGERSFPLESYIADEFAWPLIGLDRLDLKKEEEKAILGHVVKTAIAPKVRTYLDGRPCGSSVDLSDLITGECRRLKDTLDDMQWEVLRDVPRLMIERIGKEWGHA